jgi:hypothetical protein
LPIVDGWKVQDDNLLACSRPHFEAVIAMLRRLRKPAEFTGGLEALLLQDWHVDALCSLKPQPGPHTAGPEQAEELLAQPREFLEARAEEILHALDHAVLLQSHGAVAVELPEIDARPERLLEGVELFLRTAEQQRTLTLRRVTHAWITATLLPAWRTHLRSSPFVLAGNAAYDPTNIVLVTAGDDLRSAYTPGLYADVSFEITGAVD